MREKKTNKKKQLPAYFNPERFVRFIKKNLFLDLHDFREAIEKTDYRSFDLKKITALVERSERAAKIAMDCAAIAMAASKRATAMNKLLVPGAARTENNLAKLSVAERRVYLGLERGKTNKEIATELELSTETIKAHVAKILKKLGAKNRHELISVGAPY